MSATLRAMPSDLEDLFYQSVVDEDFRALVESDPTLFGLTEASVLPVAIEAQDTSLLDLTSGPTFVAQCRSTCSSGPFTVVCDGGTK